MEHISAPELKHYLADDGKPCTLLDVREAWEYDRARISNTPTETKAKPITATKHIPLGELPSRLSELDKEQDLVVVCHHGIRSYQACLFLQTQGFTKLINLHGGIDAWSKQVDASVPLYSK